MTAAISKPVAQGPPSAAASNALRNSASSVKRLLQASPILASGEMSVIGRGDLGNTTFSGQSAEYAKKLKIQHGGQIFTSNSFHKETS